MIGSKTKNVDGWTTTGFTHGSWNMVEKTLFYPSKSYYSCSDARWFAYCKNTCPGFIKTKLNKCGKASINIGNCYKSPDSFEAPWLDSYTEAKLNGKQILKVNAHENKTIEFDFKNGDIFELADIAYGVVELYDFKIISCSPC